VDIVDVASGAARPLAVEGLAALDDPAWSPDGRWLVVAGSAASGTGQDWDLYLVQTAPSAVAYQLTDGRGHDRAPAWVPR
jgi:Tol biopolymer transport system component